MTKTLARSRPNEPHSHHHETRLVDHQRVAAKARNVQVPDVIRARFPSPSVTVHRIRPVLPSLPARRRPSARRAILSASLATYLREKPRLKRFSSTDRPNVNRRRRSTSGRSSTSSRKSRRANARELAPATAVLIRRSDATAMSSSFTPLTRSSTSRGADQGSGREGHARPCLG